MKIIRLTPKAGSFGIFGSWTSSFQRPCKWIHLNNLAYLPTSHRSINSFHSLEFDDHIWMDLLVLVLWYLNIGETHHDIAYCLKWTPKHARKLLSVIRWKTSYCRLIFQPINSVYFILLLLLHLLIFRRNNRVTAVTGIKCCYFSEWISF